MSGLVLDFLSEIEPFAWLPPNTLAEAADEIIVQNKTRGTVLFFQGKSEVDSLLIVKSGTLEVYNELEGKKTLANFLERGQICGATSILMNGAVSSRTIRVEQNASLYCLSKRTFLDICHKHPDFHDFFIEAHIARMRDESYASILASGQAVQFLSSVMPFSFLPQEEIEQVAKKLSIVHYPKDSILCVQERTPLEYLYIIQKGAAERYYEENDQKRLRGLLGEGEVYGGISLLLNNGIAVRTLACIEDSYFYILHKKDFSALCSRHEAFTEYFTDIFGKRMLDRSYAAIISKTLRPKRENQQFFNQPVENIFNSDLVYCTQENSIREAARVMTRHNCSSIFVRNIPGGDFVGLATDADVRKNVVAAGLDLEQPISKIMSSPIYIISAKALLFEAMMLMTQKNVEHLAVTDSEDTVIGVVTHRDVLDAQGKSPFFLIREIAETTSLMEIVEKQKQLPHVIRDLVGSGVKAKNVSRLIAAVADSVLEKLIGMAIRQLGPPPANFVFMIMGSEGRKEQTLKTDQDNAIVFRDVPSEREESVRKYFLELGEKICNWLDEAGYEFCEGNAMAKNPKWCQPLSKWKEYFSSWIFAAQPEDLLQSSIFFDFRGAHGDMEIIEELHRFLFDSLGGWAGFFRNLTVNALHFKPPLGFFRNIVVESKGNHRNSFNIKAAMQTIVDFARIYAMKKKITETNTLERLHRLYMIKVLPWQDYCEVEQAYSFLMQLRLARQISAIMDENAQPDNYVNPKKLSRIEQTMLREIFKLIEKLQAKLGFEFTGIG